MSLRFPVRGCGDRTGIVRCRCSYCALTADSARKSLGASAGSVQRSCGDGGVTLRGLQDHRTIFCPNDNLKSFDFRKISERPPHDAPTTCLRAYDFFFQICHKSSLNKTVEARAPMNPYGNCTADACLRTEAAR